MVIGVVFQCELEALTISKTLMTFTDKANGNAC